MSFKSNAVPAETSNQNWKAQGFINFYLPGKNGARKKLGAIPLKDSRNNEKELLAWLNEDPSSVAHILSKMELAFKSAAPGDSSGFDL